jgi:hypothetical protein
MKIKAPFMVHRCGESSDSEHVLHSYKQVRFENAPTSLTGKRTVFMYKAEQVWNPLQEKNNESKPEESTSVLAPALC